MQSADVALLERPRSSTRPPRYGVWRAIASLLGVAAAAAFLVHWFFFEPLVAFVERAFSADGEISQRNRAALRTSVLDIACWTTILAGVAGSMSSPRLRRSLLYWLRTDELAAGRAGDPVRIMALSAAVGFSLIVLWVLHVGSPLDLGWLFTKERLAEITTFILLLLAAVGCGAAARRRMREGGARLIALAYSVLALGLFVVGMEEISWGQTWLQWETPERWAAINSQQETTAHNLLDQPTLHVVEQRLIYAFVALAIVGVLIAALTHRPFVVALAPHASMVPLLAMIAYAAHRFHLEAPEILFAVFMVFYAWRIYRARGTSAADASDGRRPDR